MHPASRSAEHYRRIDVSGRLTDAGPHKRVSLLLEAACSYIRRAQVCLDTGNDPAVKGQANLAALYDYLLRRLTWANANNDPSALEEALTLLSQIESAWNALSAQLN